MFIPEAAPWETHVMVQMLCAGSVCGTVISATLLTGETVLASSCWRRVPKNHLRALVLPLSPMAVSEIERKSGEEEWKGKKRRVVDLS